MVDDEEFVLLISKRILELAGFTVLTADGGRAAVEVFSEHHEQIDVVLLDLTMPDLGGDEVCRKMREIRPAMPVIVVSGFTEEHIAERFVGIGAVEFLEKPYKTENLIAIVGTVIAAHQADAG